MCRVGKLRAMSLTCSLLGHDFGDPEVEREREERGSEVVTSVREVSVCERCGKQRVISENTEVTSVLSPEEVERDADAEDVDAEGEADTTETDGDDGEEPVHPRVDAPIEDDPDGTGEDDDAVILTDDLSEREYGEWPAEPGQNYRPWDPDSLTDPDDDESEPTVAEVVGADDAGSATGGESEGRADVADAGADDPDSDTDRARPGSDDGGAATERGPRIDDANPDTGDADVADDGAEVIDADPDADAGEPLSAAADASHGAASEDAETYRCPDCGYTTAAADTSLCAGDSCPVCHEGYLAAERNH